MNSSEQHMSQSTSSTDIKPAEDTQSEPDDHDHLWLNDLEVMANHMQVSDTALVLTQTQHHTSITTICATLVRLHPSRHSVCHSEYL